MNHGVHCALVSVIVSSCGNDLNTYMLVANSISPGSDKLPPMSRLVGPCGGRIPDAGYIMVRLEVM